MDTVIIESIGYYLLRVVAAIGVLIFGRFLAGRFRNLAREVMNSQVELCWRNWKSARDIIKRAA